MSGKAITQMFKCCVAPETMASSPAATVFNGGSSKGNKSSRRLSQGRTRRIDISMIGNPTNFRHTVHIGSADVAGSGSGAAAAAGMDPEALAGMEMLDLQQQPRHIGTMVTPMTNSHQPQQQHQLQPQPAGSVSSLSPHQYPHCRDLQTILYQMSSKDNTLSNHHQIQKIPPHFLNATPIGGVGSGIVSGGSGRRYGH